MTSQNWSPVSAITEGHSFYHKLTIFDCTALYCGDTAITGGFYPHSFCMTGDLKTLFLISSHSFQIHSSIIFPQHYFSIIDPFLLVIFAHFPIKFINRTHIPVAFILRVGRRQALLSCFHTAGSPQLPITPAAPHSHHLVSMLFS